MRVAVVHDWLYVLGGAERVLREILHCYPNATVFSLFDVLTPAQREWLGYDRAVTSFLQGVPGIERWHRSLLPLLPFAIEQLDVSGYDLVISSSSSVAKGIITGPHQLHVAYVHSPMRYAWDLQERYLAESAGCCGPRPPSHVCCFTVFGFGIVRPAPARTLLSPTRSSSLGVLKSRLDAGRAKAE